MYAFERKKKSKSQSYYELKYEKPHYNNNFTNDSYSLGNLLFLSGSLDISMLQNLFIMNTLMYISYVCKSLCGFVHWVCGDDGS